jgi:trk system potassium uptake protein TrkH
MSRPGKTLWAFLILFLALVSLFLELGVRHDLIITVVIYALDLFILAAIAGEFIVGFARERYHPAYLRRHAFDAIFLAVLAVLFIVSKYTAFLVSFHQAERVAVGLIVVRNIFVVLKVLSRYRRLKTFISEFARNPAQTIVLFFLAIILLGTLLLLLPLSRAGEGRLEIVDSLFTVTSAVCVTGLTVVDTATAFSPFGKTVIALLIQFGGLGIMIFAFFTFFLMRRRMSLQEQMTVSYVLDPRDMRNLSGMVFRIILITFLIEALGAAGLFFVFRGRFGGTVVPLAFSLFHSISAFCNAGFALFTDNLESFRSDLGLNFVIAGLIILGGISFGVINNLARVVSSRIGKDKSGRNIPPVHLTLNTKVVLVGTAILLVGGTLLIYNLEHRANLVRYDLKTEYLSAFFQSVTLRTAGFNTIPLGNLRVSTYLVMILFMFIGGASGSTAGGIKVNTVAVIGAFARSVFKNRESVLLGRHSLPREMVNKALVIALLATLIVFSGTLLLSITEKDPPINLLFETVSALGTVGLSTGITPSLTVPGKLVIIVVMFLGRLGPLTVIAAMPQRKVYHVKYPEESLSIG